MHLWQDSKNSSGWQQSKSLELWHMDISRSFSLQATNRDLRVRKFCFMITVTLCAPGPKPDWQLLGTWCSFGAPCSVYRVVEKAMLKSDAQSADAFCLHQNCCGIYKVTFQALSCKGCPVFSSCYLQILLVFTVLHICLSKAFAQKIQTMFDFLPAISVCPNASSPGLHSHVVRLEIVMTTS